MFSRFGSRLKMLTLAGASVALLAAAPEDVRAQELTVIGHAVHRSAMTGPTGGDFASEWATKNRAVINWLTLNVQAVHERLYREANLRSTTIDVGFVANRYFRPQFQEMFEPLDEYLKSMPIEGFDEIPKAMLDGLTYGGKLYGIPFRHATTGLHINTEMMRSVGLSGLPKTFEEVLEYAQKLTFARPDGRKVHGLILDLRSPAIISDLAAGRGGTFMSDDFKIDWPGITSAVEAAADLYKKGILPETYLRWGAEDTITYMQQGRAAMAIAPFGRHVNFNDPAKSQVAGKVVSIALPTSRTMGGGAAAVKTEYWAMVIPKRSDGKQLAWEFIRNASTPENTIRGALNGNGPVRPSAYKDARIAQLVPYAPAEEAALKVARSPFPGFEESSRVEDIFIEEIDTVFLGAKSAADAMRSARARIEPLLPKP